MTRAAKRPRGGAWADKVREQEAEDRLQKEREAELQKKLDAAAAAEEEARGPDPNFKERRIKTGNASGKAPPPLQAVIKRKTRYCNSFPLVYPRNPKDRNLYYCAMELVLFIPAHLYPMHARGFTSLNSPTSYIETQIMYIQIMRMFGELIQLAIDMRWKDADPQEQADQDGDDDGGSSKRRKGNGSKPPPRKLVASTSRIEILWERVPHRDGVNAAGYRLYVREWQPNTSADSNIRTDFKTFIEQNSGRIKATVKSKSVGDKRKGPHQSEIEDPTSHRLINASRYLRLVSLYTGNSDDDVHKKKEINRDFYQPENELALKHVFSWPRAAEFALNCGADPAYCEQTRYYTPSWDYMGARTWDFPHKGRDVRVLHIDDLKPDSIDVQLLPHVLRDLTPYTEQIKKHMEQFKIKDFEEAKEKWGRAFFTESMAEKEFDIHALEAQIAEDDKKLRAKYTKPLPPNKAKKRHRPDEPLSQQEQAELDALEAALQTEDPMEPGYYVERRNLQRGAWNTAFEEIISPNGPCPPAAQACAKWINQFLEENNGILSMHRPMNMANLSYFANARAAQVMLLHQLWQVKSCHQDIILFYYSALNVFSRVKMNLHHMQLGEPGTGKSFAVLTMLELIIKGTYIQMAYFSPKAFAVEGRESSMMVVVLEDAPASTFGVSKNGKAQSTAASDSVNMLKAMLTDNELACKALQIDPRRESPVVIAETGMAFFICMNNHADAYESGITDRFTVTVVSADVTSNGKSEVEQMAPNAISEARRSKDPVVKEAKADFILQCMHEQSLSAMINLRESVGFYLKVDTSAADKVFNMVHNQATRRTVSMTERRRNLDRFRMLVRTQVISEAYMLYFCCPFSPVFNKKWESSMWAGIDKYLVSTVQHGMWSIGELARQFQDSTTSIIMHTMKTEFFPGKMSAELIDEFDTLPPLACAEELAHNEHERRRIAAEAARHQFLGRDHSPPKQTEEEGQEAATTTPPLETEEEATKWMYARVMFSASSDHCIRPVPKQGNREPTPTEVLKHVAQFLHAKLPRKFLLAEVESRLEAMTKANVSVTRLQIDASSAYEGQTIPNTQKCPMLLLQPDRLYLAIPALKMADNSDVVYSACNVVASVLHRLAKKRKDGTHKHYENMIYGDTEPDARYAWRMIKIDPHVEEHEFSGHDNKMEDQLEMWNVSFAENSARDMAQDMLSATNPAWSDSRYMDRLFSGMPWTREDMDFDKQAALERADKLGLCEEDQHGRLSNDVTVREPILREFYKKRRKAQDKPTWNYPECLSQMKRKEFLEAFKVKEKRNPKLFLASSRAIIMLERQRKRTRVADDASFELKVVSDSPPPLESVTGEQVEEEEVGHRSKRHKKRAVIVERLEPPPHLMQKSTPSRMEIDGEYDEQRVDDSLSLHAEAMDEIEGMLVSA